MKSLFSRLKFETKLNLGIIAIVLGMAVFLLPVVAKMTTSALVTESKLRGTALAESLAARAVNPLLARDYLATNPGKTIIAYCGTGREATNLYILFQYYLGYPNVKLYEGSFAEWSAYPVNPTVTGPNPR